MRSRRPANRPCSYCLERIPGTRIPDDRLRWLLRYAVVARRLDAEFVAEVLWPHLEAGLRDDKVLDDPGRGRPPPTARPRSSSPARHRPPSPALWDDLTTYAGATSWVQPTEDGRLVFHESLRDPVRDLLRAHLVFTALHEAAEGHYTRRGRPVEAVYHAFQHRGTAALPGWRALVEQAWRDGRADLAGELRRRPADLRHRLLRCVTRPASSRPVPRSRRCPAGPGTGCLGAHWNRAESALAAAALLGEPSAMHHALTAAVLQARDLDEQRASAEALAAGPPPEEGMGPGTGRPEVDLRVAVSSDPEIADEASTRIRPAQ